MQTTFPKPECKIQKETLMLSTQQDYRWPTHSGQMPEAGRPDSQTTCYLQDM